MEGAAPVDAGVADDDEDAEDDDEAEEVDDLDSLALDLALFVEEPEAALLVEVFAFTVTGFDAEVE